jgi:UDP-glucose 4-epimerase
LQLFEIEFKTGGNLLERVLITMNSRSIKNSWIESYRELTKFKVNTIPLSEAKSLENLKNSSNNINDPDSNDEEEIEKIKTFEILIDKQNMEINQEKKRNLELEEKLNKAFNDIKVLKLDKTNLLETYQTAINDLQVQVDQGIKKYKVELEKKLVNKDGEIQTLQSALDSKDNKINQLEAEKAGMHQALIQELNNVKKNSLQTTENLKKQLQQIQNNSQSKDTTTTKLELEKAQLQTELTKTKAMEEATRNEYRSILSNLEKTLRERQDIIQRKDLEIQEITKKYVTITEKNNELSITSEKYKNENDLLHKTSTESAINLKNEMKYLKDELEKKSNKLEKLEGSFKDLENLNNGNLRELKNLNESNAYLKFENGKLTEKLKDLDFNSNDIMNERNKLQNVINALSEDQYLLFGSTGSNYGEVLDVCTEETPLNPLSIYGRTKTDAEYLVLARDNSTAFRFATAFGVSPRLRLDLLVNDLTFKSLTEGYAVIYESHFMRTFIHVKDIARVFLFAIEHQDEMKDNVYNVGSNTMNYSKKEVCEMINFKVPNSYFNYADVGSDADKRNYIVSYEKLNKLGYTTTITLEEGIDELLKTIPLIKTSSPYFNVLK